MNASTPLYKRPIAIASAVALLHVGGLAALQSGLLVRAYELVVPVEMISQIIEPPKPIEPAPPPEPTPALQPPTKVTKAVALPPAPQPLAIADPAPAPNALAVVPTPPAPLPPMTAPVAVVPSPAPVAAPSPPPPALPAPKIELPRSDADHLSNPVPPYPLMSKRLGEEGTAVLRIYVAADGSPQKAELRTSSGFDRLDQVALSAVMKWRFKPGTRNGLPEAMWVTQPIPFVLNR